MKITCGAIVFPFLNTISDWNFYGTGRQSDAVQSKCGIGLAANMILDPVMIFGVGPVPQMREAGAAVATVTAQMVVTLCFVSSDKKEIWNCFPEYMFSGKHLGSIWRL